jgi:hypothetical protein
MQVLLKGFVAGSPLMICIKLEQQLAVTETLILACLRPDFEGLAIVASTVEFGTKRATGRERISKDPKIVAEPSHPDFAQGTVAEQFPSTVRK